MEVIYYPSTTIWLQESFMQILSKFLSDEHFVLSWPLTIDFHHLCNLGADSEADTEAGDERGTNKASSASVVKVCWHQLL